MDKGLFCRFSTGDRRYIATNQGGDSGFKLEFANLEQALASYRDIMAVMESIKPLNRWAIIRYWRRVPATGQLWRYCLLDQALIAEKSG